MSLSAPQASPWKKHLLSKCPRGKFEKFDVREVNGSSLESKLTVSQQRTPDLRLLSLAKKSGMFQCTSNTRYLVMPPSSPSLKWHDETLVTGWKHFWKKVDYDHSKGCSEIFRKFIHFGADRLPLGGVKKSQENHLMLTQKNFPFSSLAEFRIIESHLE